MRSPPSDVVCIVYGHSPEVPCGFAGSVLPPPFLAFRPGLPGHHCHSRGRPTSTGLPGLGPGCNRRWSPQSGSSLPASRENPRPSAVCCSAPFCTPYGLVAATGPSSIGVELDLAGINHQPLEVRFVNDGIQQVLPYPPVSPATEPTVGISPVPQVWWQVSPGRPSTQVPKHGVQKQPVVPGWPPLFTWSSRQMRLQKLPNPVRNVVASMCCRHIPTPHFHSHHSNLTPCYHFDDTP